MALFILWTPQSIKCGVPKCGVPKCGVLNEISRLKMKRDVREISGVTQC